MIKIDADMLFRAVTATGFKLLAYNLDLRTGEIISRTLSAGEIPTAPEAPSVKPLPKMGGDLQAKKESHPFGPPAVSSKPKLFKDDDTPNKPAFAGDFWKRDDTKKPGPFGEFKRESGSKKLAELFGDAPKNKASGIQPPEKNAGLPTGGTSDAALPSSIHDPYCPRIPAASEAAQLEWMRSFSKDAGDPQIRDELLAALHGPKPASGFERILRNHARSAQQWERYHRKQALASAAAWLATLGIQWELLERG